MTIRVENNFLNEDIFWDISRIIMNSNFPWYRENNKKNHFVHNLIHNLDLKKEHSFYVDKILPSIMIKLNLKNVVSSRLTFNFPDIDSEKQFFSPEEINLNDKSLRGLLCINTNNSKIEITGTDKISSVENKFISFPRNQSYFIWPNTDKCVRLILEIVYNVS
tara:strand:- start:19 stop:507 length:489 start_codon:yes stop_codon:yes gene_type:complete